MQIKSQREEYRPKRIAVIGGGLGGCLTALMLAKQLLLDEKGRPVIDESTGKSIRRYHITLIEAEDKLLTGASLLASRLHLGGEYPLDAKTAQDCLNGAILWKLLMPKTIYTAAPPMKFLISQETENEGNAPDEPATPEKQETTKVSDAQEPAPPKKKKLTLEIQRNAYEAVRALYEEQFKRIRNAFLGCNEETVKSVSETLVQRVASEVSGLLFGAYTEGSFYKELTSAECEQYGYYGVAGGFQSQEPGINVPKYLTMLEKAVYAEKELGNIDILLNHKVSYNGITGEKGNIKIRFNNIPFRSPKDEPKYDQVVQAAWEGGLNITPPLGTEHGEDENKKVIVYKRAMLFIDLPPKWETSPAFIMLDKNGGMLSPYNDRVAVCYLPVQGAGHMRKITLESGSNFMPTDWDKKLTGDTETKKAIKDTPEAREEWARKYYAKLQARFPMLENWSYEQACPQMMIRDTLNFQSHEEERRHEHTTEGHMPADSGMAMVKEVVQGIGLSLQQEMRAELLQRPEMEQNLTQELIQELTPGKFVLYPAKATYGIVAARQAVQMVNERDARSQDQDKEPISSPKDTLGLFLKATPEETRKEIENFSLAGMPEPRRAEVESFCRARDVKPAMADISWPMQPGTHIRVGDARQLRGIRI